MTAYLPCDGSSPSDAVSVLKCQPNRQPQARPLGFSSGQYHRAPTIIKSGYTWQYFHYAERLFPNVSRKNTGSPDKSGRFYDDVTAVASKSSTSGLSRRRLLTLIGAGAALPLSSGTASAHGLPYTVIHENQPGTSADIETLIEEMTLDEKVTKVHNHFGSGGVELPIGYMAPTGRLDMPHMELADGPSGIRHPFRLSAPEDLTNIPFGAVTGGPSTAFPSPLGVAASWDRELIKSFGFALGREAKAKGQAAVYAPTMDIVRVPVCGRAFDNLGEDPYLASRAAVAAVRGIQSAGTIATAKHYVANNQEADREVMSAAVDERTLREIYLPPFKAAVKEANVGSVMAAYNRVNGTYCTENERLLTEILKDEWGFSGYVVSDYGAVHSTVPAANAGLDFEGYAGPVQEGYFGPELRRAVENGAVSNAVVDEKVRRILTQQRRFGILQNERVGPPGAANTRDHQLLARRIATEGSVLLKNEAPGLPLALSDIDSIGVIGHNAKSIVTGGGSSNVTPPYSVSPLAGIRSYTDETPVLHASGKHSTSFAASVAERTDVAIVVADGTATESEDRADLSLDGNQNELISAVADANDHTVVILRTPGAVVMPWLDSVSAVLEMWYPGMEDGNAAAELLFGDATPSGKLPVTFGKELQDYPVTTEQQYPGVETGEGYPVAEYSEGVFIGYRHFDQENTDPLFPFGHGHTYTTFEYADLTVASTAQSSDAIANVELSVSNVGDRSAKEIVQLYVGDRHASVARPPKELAAFTKVDIPAGDTQSVQFQLGSDAFSYYDREAQRDSGSQAQSSDNNGGWRLEPGTFDILVGSSSRDIRLRETITV